MKKQEALDLIKAKKQEGLSNEQISALLKEDGKIGNHNITDELIADLFKEAEEAVSNQGSGKPKEANTKTPLYEEWSVKVEEKKLIKVKRLKDVRISEEQAAVLNSRLKNVQYYKK